MGIYSSIRDLCKKRGISIRKFEQDCSFSHGSVSKWDDHKPSFDKLSTTASYFGVTVDYLTGDDNVQNQGQDGYYTNPETAKIAQEIFETPGYRILFDAAKDSKPEDLQMAADLLRRLKGENSNDPC